MQKATTMLGILLTCLFLVAHSGHIYPQDIQISPNNKNTPSEILLVFTLDTSLAPTDYLRIIFPFRLNSIQPALWDAYSNFTLNTTTNKGAVVTASTITGDSTSYFVQFYTDTTSTTLSNLTSGVLYYLKITGTPDPSAQTGLNAPVQLLTVSNNVGNWIIYDYNSVFGTLTLADAYPSTMTVKIAIPSTSTGATVLGNSYKINVTITPTKTITSRARIDIQFTNTAFSLLSCTNVNSTSESIASLPSSFTVLNAYTIRATISKTLTAGNGAKYRFQCTVRNPANTGTTKVLVKNRMGYIESITESGTDSTGLTASTTSSSTSTTTTSAWDESFHQVQLGWGYVASQSGALAIFALYKDASPTERWYQSVKTIFKTKADLAYTSSVQVLVSTVNDASFKILTATIYHNLPNYNSTSIVNCSVVTQGYLTCVNVGILSAATQYWVSFRFNLLSTATVNTVSDFGKVQVQTQATSPVVLLALSSTTLYNKVVKTNVALYTSSSTNGIIAYSTPKSSGIPTQYVTNGENIILKFAFKYFTSSFIPLSTTNIDRGIELYTSQSLGPSSNPTCTIGALLQGTDINITNCAVDQMSSYTRLRFRIGRFVRTTGTPATQFTTTIQDGTIAFDWVQFTSSQFSSLNYVNTNVYDYYARWVQDFTNTTNPSVNIATGSSSFFFNSLVYLKGALTNVNVGTTFFVTGASASAANNDGTYFPTLIRITGYLNTSPDEQTGTDRLLLFFNDLEPLNYATPCFGPTGIVCKYVANGVENTATDSLTDYSGSRRIEITVNTAQRFNIYIPVSTISQKTSIGFFITTASIVDATQGIFATRLSKRINQFTSTMTTYSIDPVGSTPKISVTGSPTMGNVISSTTITGLSSSYVPNAANTASLFGAAYGYCANYDFTTATGFTLTPFYSGSATPEQYCVAIQYSPSTTKTVTCKVCPVHNTMTSSSTLTLTQFTLPTMAGQDFYDLVYVVGNNNGNFAKAAKDNQATVMTAFKLSSLGITFNPTVFKKTSKNVYARISFTIGSPLPQAIRINITPSGSSTSLLVNPVSTVACLVNTTTATSCVISGSSTNIQIDAVATALTWPTGTHMIDFMIDTTTAAASISANTAVTFQATIKVNGISALSALHHASTTTAPTYTITNQASNYIGLYNVTYLFGNKNARSVIDFTFGLPSDINVYPAQTIVFNLGGIATANVGETPICFVRDPITWQVSNDFASCDVSDLTQLTLQSKATVTGNYTLELQFLHVPSSAAPAGISAMVLAADGSTIVAQNLQTTPLTLPTTPASKLIPTLNVNLNRLYSDPGNVAEFVLTLKPSVKAVTISTHLYMYFPTYYADKLGYQNIWCLANSLPIQCALMGDRIIHLSSFPVNVAIGATLTVTVYGVITPVVPSTPGKIFIALADTSSVFTLTEQLEVSDIASATNLPTTLTISTFSVTTQEIRETTSYTIAFTTDAIGIRTNRIITIDFPDRYGNILGGIDAPKVLLSATGSSTTTSITTTAIGSRFKIVPPYNLNPSTSYTFVIQGIDNPEDPSCYMDRPMISVTDTTESVAISRTAPNTWNVPVMSYYSDTSLDALSWVDVNGNPVTALQLSIGIFSQELRVIPPTPDLFQNDITFTQSNTALSVLPSTLTVTRGDPYMSVRVSATSSTFPRIILLDLNKDESTTNNIYAELPKLQLVLTNTINILPTNAIRIVIGGTSSLPYSWDLKALNLIPNTQLTMAVSIVNSTVSSLSVLGASSISFGPSTTQAGFTFILSNDVNATNPPVFTITLGGTDSANYQLFNSTVTVTLEPNTTIAPVLLQAIPTPNYGPTTQQFAIIADQMVTIYWHVAYENKLSDTDCLRVRSSYNGGTAYSSSSPTQAQYGVFYIYTENVISYQVMSNLYSNQVYSYIMCPSNQQSNLGAPLTGTFTTKDNLARQDRVNIVFSTALTTTQLTSVVCMFTNEFQLPDLNVVAMDGTSCETSSVLDDKSSFDYRSISIYINGDRGSIFTDTVGSSLIIDVQNVSTQTASTFLTTFNQGLRGAGISTYYRAISLNTGITYNLPTFPSSSYKASTTIFDTKVTLYGLELSSGPGIFYAIATTDTTTVPTQAQIRAKKNGLSVTCSGGNVLFNSASVSITLTGLKDDTDYLIYYYASNADLTQYVRVTDVMVNSVRTKPSDAASGFRTEMSIVAVIFMTAIAWLF